MRFPHLRRGGRYYRVCDPSWADPSDTSYSQHFGGRWNVADGSGQPGFGALYLNATVEVARANARRHAQQSFGVSLDDLVDERLPDLQHYDVVESDFVDAVTPAAVRALGLSRDYPMVPKAPCQRIAAEAYANGEHGIAVLCAVDASGEELAIFDRDVEALASKAQRDRFAQWHGA